MSRLANMFSDFVTLCQDAKISAPINVKQNVCFFGPPYPVTLDDLTDYFDNCNMKVTICVKDLKKAKELKPKYPQYNFTSIRQGNPYDGDLVVIMNFNDLDANEQGYRSSLLPHYYKNNGNNKDYLVICVG